MIRKFLLLLSAVTIHAQVLVDPYSFGTTPGNNLADDLLAVWRFEETSGHPQDSSGNGRHLTHYGNSETGLGILGNTRYHDASTDDDYFGIASDTWNTFGSSDFTIALWYKVDDSQGTVVDQVIIAKADVNVSISWSIGIDYGAYPFGYSMGFWRSTTGAIGDYGNSLAIDFPETIVGGTAWYCVIVTRSGNDWTMYFGKQGESTWIDTDTVTETVTLPDNSTVPLTIGSYLADGAVVTDQDAYGSIDEVVISSRAWTECEALKYFNGGSGLVFTDYNSNACN